MILLGNTVGTPPFQLSKYNKESRNGWEAVLSSQLIFYIEERAGPVETESVRTR